MGVLQYTIGGTACCLLGAISGLLLASYHRQVSIVPAQTTPATLPGKCPTGDNWFEYAEHCYLLVPDGYSTWEQAKEECEEKAFLSTIASIHSYLENKMILDRLIQKGYGNRDMWIGLYRSSLDRTRMKWTDGTAFQYEAWSPAEPNGKASKEDCVRMRNQHLPGKWDDHRCSVYLGYICKAPKLPAQMTLATLPKKCPNGDDWFEYAEYCYLFVPYGYSTWEQAKEECQKKAFLSTIASIHSYLENKMILYRLIEMGYGYRDVWIGLYRSNLHRSRMKWTDGTALQYEAWAPAEPNWEASKEDCVRMWNQHMPGKWDDHRCSVYLGYVCKAPKAPHVSPPTSSPKCDQGWHHSLVTDHCYLFKPDDSRPYNVALRMCRDKGGSDLASIHDAFEMREVRVGMKRFSILPPEMMDTHYWFGMAIKKTEEDKFIYYWTDGTDHDYDNWYSGEQIDPEYFPCVNANMGDGKWSTWPCGHSYGWVCKKPRKQDNKPTAKSNVGVMVAGGYVSVVFISSLVGLIFRFPP